MSQPYPQQPPWQQPPRQPYPQQSSAPAPPARARTSRFAVSALVVGVLNLALTVYLVIVVIRAQVALSELGKAFANFPGGLGGFGG